MILGNGNIAPNKLLNKCYGNKDFYLRSSVQIIPGKQAKDTPNSNNPFGYCPSYNFKRVWYWSIDILKHFMLQIQ